MQVFSAPPRAVVVSAKGTIAALAIRLHTLASFRQKLPQLVGKFRTSPGKRLAYRDPRHARDKPGHDEEGSQIALRAVVAVPDSPHSRRIRSKPLAQFSKSMASSFETHRFAMLPRMRSQTLMVRSATSRVSNHEASGEATMIRANRSVF
jgi:hypothetical protein